MKTFTELPPSHQGKQIACIALEQSKVLSKLLKTVQALLAAALFAAGCLFLPPNALTGMTEPFEHLSALMLGMLSLSIVQELLRALLMRLFSGVRPVLRFSGAYLHAGCEAYFGRRQEQIINLAPVIVVPAFLLALFLSTADASWKWMVWIVLVVAICLSVGYCYASMRFQQLPDDILVQNVGSTYLVYSARGQEENTKP